MNFYIKTPVPPLPALLTLPSLYILRALKTLISYLETLFPIPSNRMDNSLRVSRITFFTHGLACLEHTATVQDDTRHMLSVNPSAMADLLKTLTVHPGTGGTVKSVTYDAPPSRDDRASTHMLTNILTRENRSSEDHAPTSTHVITELLKEHIGSPMTAFHDKGSVTGRVMGLQHVQGAGTKSRDDAVVLLQDDGLIVPVRLSHLQGVRMDGPKGEDIAARFRRAAERGRIGVTIVTKGDDERKLTVRYAIEAPVYKVTYRIMLLDEHSLYIQAWAIVDNPSDEKLDDVEVVIISGLPMSFRHDVYQARYISRPVEPVSKHAGITAGGVDIARVQLCSAPKGGQAYFQSEDMSPHTVGQETSQNFELEQDTIPRWSDAAEAAAAGSVHQYRIPGRVTIPARESALLPLIMATTPGGQVDMYVHHIRATNTLRAAKIMNNTTAPFERGPVAVYDENTLVGEGMLSACQPGADVLMPYSVNLQCKVDKRETDGKGGIVTECFASSGNFHFKRYFEKATMYDFSEQNERLEVVVVHGHRKGHERVSAEILPTEHVHDNTVKGTKITPENEEGRVCHFHIKLEPGVKTSLRVIESHLVSSTYDISKMFQTGILATITHEGLVGKDAVGRMRRLTATKEELNQVEREIHKLKENAMDLETTQKRYRENIMALGGGHGRMKDSGLVVEYAQRIRDSETKIEAIKLQMKEKEGVATELKNRMMKVMAEFENIELEKKTEEGEGSPGG